MTKSSWLAVLTALLLALSTVACGSDDPAPEPVDNPAAEPEQDDSAITGEEGEDTAEEPRGDGDVAGGESGSAEGFESFGLDFEPADPVSWTYLVYSLADTNLESPMLADVAEMATFGSAPDSNVVAMVDRQSEETDEPLLNLDDWETAKLLYVDPGELFEMADLGEVDMADPDVLAAFIEFGISTFPADNYALTISDHGGGWTGIGPDDSSGEVLDLQELESAIGAGLAASGVERLSLLGFDACLMATYEVASTLAPHADYLLASEELEPGHGWDYGALGLLHDDPTADPATLGAAFVQGFEAQAIEQDTAAEITLSLIDLAGMAALDQAMADFAGVLTEQVEGLGVLIGRQLANNVSYGRSPDPSQSTHLTDLGQFVSEIGVASLQVSDPADTVLRAINDVVVAQTVGPARLGSTGMSIYFPPVIELTDGAYQEVAAAESWVQFLISYYDTGQAIPPEGQPAIAGEGRGPAAAPAEAPAFGSGESAGEVVGGDATVEVVDGGVEVTVQVEPASLPNIVEATLSFGYIDPDDGAIVQLGDTQAEIFDDGTIGGFTDLTVLTLTDIDDDTIDAYLSLEFSEDGSLAFASVPLDYVEPGSDELQPVDLTIVLDAESGEVLQEVYYLIDEEAGSYGELQANPEALISPVVQVFLPDGTAEWQGYGDVALFADLPNLAYGLEPLDPGTEIYVDITVTDYGGNSLIASATFLQE